MTVHLTDEQARVIGALLEKEITTPDLYPLTLNSLTTACNQKSNREPVVTYSESQTQTIVDELVAKKLIMCQQASGNRAPKYLHRFCNTQFSDLQFTAKQLALVCVLLLRGPQTPGELRTRTQRLTEFDDVTDVQKSLTELQALNGHQWVMRLNKAPGKREAKYCHLFSGQPDPAAQSVTQSATPNLESDSPALAARLDTLEQQVAMLSEQIIELKQRLGD